MAALTPVPKIQFFAANGEPLVGGKLYSYAAGTTTPLVTYTDQAATSANTNPVILDSRGEASVWLGTGPYKLRLTTATDVDIWTVDDIYSEGALSMQELLSSAGSSLVGFIQSGTGATYRTVQSKLRDTVSVKDFGAVGDGVTDDTAAFNAAQGTGNITLLMPPGTYVLNNFRLKTGARLVGMGYETTAIKQGVAGNPAVNCTSDVTTGQISSAGLLNCKVIGATSATVAAVLVAADGPWAVWKSTFDFVASLTYRALEVQAATANNVFRCWFKVTSQDTTNTAVLINGGVYNNFDLFLTNTSNGRALDFTGLACFFTRAVADGQLWFRGSQTVINNATVEEMYVNGSSISGQAAIVSTGFTETFINPMVVLNSASAAKVSFAFSPFDNTVFINPKVLAPTLANPFQNSNSFKFTIVGPGQSTTTNKMNTLFVDDDASTTNTLRRVSFVGDCSQWITANTPLAGRAIQYLAPSASFNFVVKNNTSQVIWEPTGTLAFCNLNLPYIPVDGQVVSFSTTQTITTLNIGTTFPTGVNVSLVPTTITASTPFSIIYSAANNKWYKV